MDDGSTVEVGIGNIPQAVLRYLGEKNDIGIHTEMFNDAIMPLVEKGVINGSRKTINRGRVTASFCLGTRRLYDYIHENTDFRVPAFRICQRPLRDRPAQQDDRDQRGASRST